MQTLFRSIRFPARLSLLVLSAFIFLSCGAVTLTVDSSTDRIAPFTTESGIAPDTLLIAPRHGRELEIGEYAFWGCASLTTVIAAEDAPLKICEGAFRDCVSLTGISLPSGSSITGSYAFSGCNALSRAVLPSGITVIPPHTFSYCRSLSAIDIPASVTAIGNNAFSECSALRHIILPSHIKSLESYAFSGCESLISATLPANDSLLGELIFSGCRKLALLTVPSAVPPPFDCDSAIFEPEDTSLFRQCLLTVPFSAADAYRAAPGWSMFHNVTETGDGTTVR